MNRQQRLERKKKKRAKTRKIHLEQNRLRLDGFFEKKILYEQVHFDPLIIPDRNDAEGWERLNLFRNPKTVIDMAKKLYSKDKILRQWLTQQIGPNERDKHNHIWSILLRSSFEVKNDAPYFMPIVTMDGTVPSYQFFLFKKSLHDQYTLVYSNKTIKLKGKEYEIVFSAHAIERLWERTSFAQDKVVRGMIFASLIRNFITEVTGKDDIIALLNRAKSLEEIFGKTQPFGYCPIVVVGNKIKLVTFLLPGYKGTPEYDLGNIRIEAENIGELEKYREQFSSLGALNLFTETSRV